jgi:hypothetical protein
MAPGSSLLIKVQVAAVIRKARWPQIQHEKKTSGFLRWLLGSRTG